jgi:hypothetical protein
MVGGAFMLQSKEEPTNSAEVMTPSTRRLIHWVDMTKVQVDGEGTLAHPLENVAQVARQRLRQSLPIAIVCWSRPRIRRVERRWRAMVV